VRGTTILFFMGSVEEIPRRVDNNLEFLHYILEWCSLSGVPRKETVKKTKEFSKIWSELFHEHFRLDEKTIQGNSHSDDCLYFVKYEREESKKEEKKESNEEKFFVRRRDGKLLPEKGDPTINWEETFFLNTLLHHFEYQMDVSVRVRKHEAESGKKKLEVVKRVSKKVYATPNKIRMDTNKAEEVQLTYPILYFAIDDFNEAWKDISLNAEGQLVCVELFASGDFFVPGKNIKTRLFAGALDYEVVKKEYVAKKWMWSSATTSHFFNLKGPNGKGAAQMAVTGQQEIPLSPGSWSKFGGAIKRMSSNSNQNPILNCSLTFLNMQWDMLVADIINVFESS